MANKVSVLIDVATDKAVSGLKGFKASVNDADGAVGKMKAGAASAFGAIQQHAATMALAAGAALVSFGVKAVGAFTELSLEAGKFRDVSGATLDEASRWIAVGDDIGVSGDAISGAWNKMNVAIGAGKPLLKEYGIELKKTADGQADANATFLNAIDTINGIKDPTKRAELAAATFGKGWTSMSELIEQGSDTIVASMGEVSDAQIIDDSELAKAKQYRESMDKLKDSLGDVAITAGEELAPAIAVAAEVLSDLVPVAGKVASQLGQKFVYIADSAYALGQSIADMVDALPFVEMADMVGPTLYEWQKLELATADLVAKFAEGAPTMEEFVAAMEAGGVSTSRQALAIIEYRKQLDGVNTSTGVAVDATEELTVSTEGSTLAHWDAAEAAAALEKADKAAADAQKEAKDAADDYNRVLQDQRDATDELVGAKTALVGGDIAVRDAQREAAAAVEALNVLTKEGKADTEEFAVAQDAAATAMLGAAQAAADEQIAVAEANGAVVGAQTANEILKQKLIELAGTLAPGSPLLSQILGYIDALNHIPRDIETRIRATGGGSTIGLLPHGPGYQGATGGIVTRPTVALIGEDGPEAVVPLNQSPGSSPLGGLGAPVNITVNAGMGADGHRIGDAVVNAIKDFERRNGTAWRR